MNLKQAIGVGEIAPRLLDWYQTNARSLPWRVGPDDPNAAPRGDSLLKRRPDPYAVWLSEIMLQQTTVATVKPRYKSFLDRWPTVSALASAPLDDLLGAWAGLGYYARARNLHKCACIIATEYDGVFPDTEDALRALPGIGAYTAAAIAAIAFDRHAIVIDGNVERVTARLFAIDKPLKDAKPEIKACTEKYWPPEDGAGRRQARSGDFAQALMDLGATVCTPKSPSCLLCPVRGACLAYATGDPTAFPVKPTKRAKPTRYGAVYALFNSKEQILLERRPEQGLLGAMLGVPGGAWTTDPDALAPPGPPWQENMPAEPDGNWRCAGEVRHSFTHFHLELRVFVGAAPRGFKKPADLQWYRAADTATPTVMRKAIDCAIAAREPSVQE